MTTTTKLNKQDVRAAQVAVNAFLDGHDTLRITLLESMVAAGFGDWASAETVALAAVSKRYDCPIVKGQRGDTLSPKSTKYQAAKTALRRVREAFQADPEGKAPQQKSPMEKFCAAINTAKKSGVTYTRAKRALDKLFGI
jgi:hypothetical protein